MAKEWILNSAMNRFQLNFKRNVGAVSEAIRTCSPRNVDEWQKYYYKNVRPKAHIDELGRKLFIKITQVISAEVETITEEECILYMRQLVIDRTYDGYTTEIQTIHGQLTKLIALPIEPAPDEWDRGYNVDFYIQVGKYYIGIQIKPVSNVSMIPEIYKEKGIQLESHALFKDKFGGEVFYVFSIKEGGQKRIQNLEIINGIKLEIARLNDRNDS